MNDVHRIAAILHDAEQSRLEPPQAELAWTECMNADEHQAEAGAIVADRGDVRRAAEDLLDSLPVMLGVKQGDVTDAFARLGRLSIMVRDD